MLVAVRIHGAREDRQHATPSASSSKDCSQALVQLDDPINLLNFVLNKKFIIFLLHFVVGRHHSYPQLQQSE